ncbi:OmpH family outer membrane protein [Kiritimatiella glycovorans]|uniref:Periplasmic chaperone n=1 Tax=Kiritimatiella glycovorans TaxID=1307763 RepID=A0A0G3EDM6_9BACT|nr:OmpH family outer membrane protein [Kiritimatiella glycovorans]AKJ64428.1 periplasmic chaperone [Kiritimatiella glycovorans]
MIRACSRKTGFLAAILGLVAAHSVFAAEEIVFIDLAKVFNDYYKTKLADTQLKAQIGEVKDQAQGMVDTFERLQNEFEKLREEAKDETLSEEVRDAKRAEAEEKLVELQEQRSRINEFEQRHNKQFQNQKQRMRQRILAEVNEAIRDRAELKGYRAVLNFNRIGSGGGFGTVMYHDDDAEITADVLSILNKSRPEDEEDENDDED